MTSHQVRKTICHKQTLHGAAIYALNIALNSMGQHSWTQ